MAYTTIDNPEKFFQCFLYTGGDGNTEHDFGGADAMQPDLVWIKNRTQSDNFALIDSVRGSRFWLGCNVQDQEDYNNEAYLFNFRSDGFTTSNTDVVGKNTETYVSWNWKAGTSFTNDASRSEEHTSELQSRLHLVCRLLLEKKKNPKKNKKKKIIKIKINNTV